MKLPIEKWIMERNFSEGLPIF